ncbi:class I SAM-dependent methyltransferase [Amorphoplanes nipponensis]|uniref:class I SAM-dependent methyltransferase n=1 Tax=Actinoplanes nipponensis TaxID=135950 RepID=UPI0031EC4852
MPTLPPRMPHFGRRYAGRVVIGTDAPRYDRARPGYPEALVARVVAGSPGPDVLDVGCGTGIAARQFQAAGCTVLGVEPDARMAAFARNRGLPVEVAAFEDWEPAGRTFDTVIAAQSWHWIDPAAGAAQAARVLRPSGRLAVFGHVFEPPPEVAEPFAAAYRRVAPDSPFAAAPTRRPLETYQDGYAQVAARLRETGRFAEPEQWRFDTDRTYRRDDWLAPAAHHRRPDPAAGGPHGRDPPRGRRRHRRGGRPLHDAAHDPGGHRRTDRPGTLSRCAHSPGPRHWPGDAGR